jgi:hypothetical protein
MGKLKQRKSIYKIYITLNTGSQYVTYVPLFQYQKLISLRMTSCVLDKSLADMLVYLTVEELYQSWILASYNSGHSLTDAIHHIYEQYKTGDATLT